MDFYHELLEMSEEERTSAIKERLEMFQETANKDKKFVGYQIGEKPEYCLDETGENICMTIRCFHDGFLPIDTKIVYGAFFMPNGKATNQGNYYYVDDSSYIYDFCNMLIEYGIDDEYDFFDMILLYLRKYFGAIQGRDREDMLSLIVDQNGEFLTPTMEHRLNWFQGMGNAFCSEYAVMAQNILSFFGFDTYVVIGQEHTNGQKEESHAFNIVSFNSSKDSDRVNILLDFSNFVKVLDMDFKIIGEAPYIGDLGDFDEDQFFRVLHDEEHLIFPDYYYYFLGDTQMRMVFDRDRDYYVSNTLFADSIPCKQKRK